MAISLLNGILIPSAVADAPIQLGEYVTMGAYNGDPIKWRCVAFEKIVGTDENGNPIMDSTQTATEPTAGYLPLMLADTYVCSKMFDMSGFNTTDSSHGRDSNNRPYPSSGGSNYWADSNLRCWLNSDAEAGMVEYTCGNRPPYWSEQGFLTYFTQQERDNIKTVTQKSLLAECDYNALPTDKRSGSELYAAESLTSVSSAVANYNVAYS